MTTVHLRSPGTSTVFLLLMVLISIGVVERDGIVIAPSYLAAVAARGKPRS